MTTRRRRRGHDRGAVALVALVVALVIIGEVRTHLADAAGIVVLAAVCAVALAGVRVRAQRRARTTRVALARNLDQLRALTPAAFETTTADVLGAHGWRLAVVGGAGDEGADLTGTDAEGRPAIVQCKRYSADHLVGSPTVQLAIGARTIYRAERVLVVTSAAFTKPARALAAREHVDLLDGPALAALAASAQSPAPAS